MMKKRYGFLFLFLFFAETPWDGVIEWQTYTGMNEIRSLEFKNNNVYTGTNGGFFIYNRNSDNYNIYTNTDGLSYNNVKKIVFDSAENLWIGLGNGSVDIFNTEMNVEKTIIIDVQNIGINDFVLNDNDIYLAADFGITHYLINKDEVKASFRNLGTFDRNTEVKTLFISDDRIWAGTDYGIARSSLTYPNLQDPQFWQNYTTADNLPDNKIFAFIKYDNKIFAATEKGSAYYDGTQWVKVLNGLNERVSDLIVYQGKLYAGGYSGVYEFNDINESWSLIGKNIWDISIIRFDDEGNLWAGTNKKGLYVYNTSGGEWESKMPSVPAGNYFTDLDVDKDGVLWAVSGNSGNRGIYSFNGTEWKNYSVDDGLSSNNVSSVTTDNENRKWFGTPGFGAVTIEENPRVITVYNSDDGKLAGSDTPSFVIVDDIGVDESGIVWLLNRYANNDKALAAVTPDFTWHYFSLQDGLNSLELSCIAFDEDGKVWIGTSGVYPRGINVLDHKGTIDDKSDDEWEYYSTSDGLESNDINAITIDRSGYMWAATTEGANYWNGSKFSNVFELPHTYVHSIEVDPFNNKWFGTKGGVGVLDKYNFKWKYYNTSNSELVDDNVLSIAIDEATGYIYFGTGEGLSMAKTTYKIPDEEADDLTVYPNPFIPVENSEGLVIGDLEKDSSVKIFSVSGRLVKYITVDSGELFGSKAFWDGKDEDGNPVSSGVYLLIAYTEGGKIKKGKVAVIRK
ncbi:T9SS type A sorting domain-containing protein [bacterium]|nr:T9SS type A sorting domain-containing protein [bacterium]